MIRLFIIFVCVKLVLSDPFNNTDVLQELQNQTRRILKGHDVGDTRPYMVFLRPASTATYQIESNWACGGAIIDERYILTSAACIEEVKHFYVVAGSRTWISPKNNTSECVNNGAKKAVWKCVPKSYVFDGNEFDNIRWMMNDIAVVKVEDDFNFQRRIKGCDFIPQKVSYNNKSKDLEKSGSIASIAGWGATDFFSDIIDTSLRSSLAKNSESLLETDVVILNKKDCKKRWNERYHDIIDKYMICGKDGMDTLSMSAACAANDINCKEMNYSEEEEEEVEYTRRKSMKIPDPGKNDVWGPSARRNKPVSGGFCENDHGGPLLIGHGKSSMIIGVISASQIGEQGNRCFGPFLYTSVYNNRHLISCAINRETGSTCRTLLRASRTQMFESVYNWSAHPDGPAKSDVRKTALRKDTTKRNPSPLIPLANAGGGSSKISLGIARHGRIRSEEAGKGCLAAVSTKPQGLASFSVGDQDSLWVAVLHLAGERGCSVCSPKEAELVRYPYDLIRFCPVCGEASGMLGCGGQGFYYGAWA